MTNIAGIAIRVPNSYSMSGYDVDILCTQASEILFDEMRELFSLCDTTTVQWIPGRRPIGYDPTEGNVNTVYITWTHGNKPENGFYLLRGFNIVENESPFGHAQGFTASLTFLGTLAYLVSAYMVTSLEVETSDWSI